jgi:hypothetical protein
MRRQKFTTILGAVLAFACVAKAGLAQTQASTAAQPSGDQSQSTAALDDDDFSVTLLVSHPGLSRIYRVGLNRRTFSSFEVPRRTRDMYVPAPCDTKICRGPR